MIKIKPFTHAFCCIFFLFIGKSSLYAQNVYYEANESEGFESINPVKKYFLDLHTGIDTWSIQSNEPEHPENLYSLFSRKSFQNEIKMPNSATKWPYRDASPWITLHGSYQTSARLKFVSKMQANQAFGGRIDELSVDYSLSPSLGFRAGVVDYKTSWCSDYEENSSWIHNPNQFCSDSYNKPLVSSAPGLQSYTNFFIDSYQVQMLAGIYNPKFASYDDLENGRRTIDNNFNTLSNHKYGLSLNLLNTTSATEYRMSWLHSDIEENPQYQQSAIVFSDGIQHNYSTQSNDIIYLAVRTPLSNRTRIELNAWQFKGNQDEFTHNQTVNYYDYAFKNSTYMLSFEVNLSYLKNEADSYIAGYSQTVRRKLFTPIKIDNPNDIITYPEDELFQYTNQSVSFAWHHDWSKHVSTTVQLIHNQLITALRASVNPYSPITTQSNAIGVRLAYHL